MKNKIRPVNSLFLKLSTDVFRLPQVTKTMECKIIGRGTTAFNSMSSPCSFHSIYIMWAVQGEEKGYSG